MQFELLASAVIFNGIDAYPIVKWLALVALIKLSFWYAQRTRRKLSKLRR